VETAVASSEKNPYVDYSEESQSGFKNITKTKIHKVKRGDNIGEISQKYGVSVANIKKWNKLRNNNVMLGSNLKIVTTERIAVAPKKLPKPAVKAKDTTTTAIASVEKKATKEIVLEDKIEVADESEFYTVQKGDNLNSIAKKYGVTTAQIREWNNMEDTNVLLGSKLKLIKAENTAIAETKAEKTEHQIATSVKEQQQYLVKKGDSLFSIAKKSGVTVENIKEWNGIGNETIKPGMKLKIQG